MIEIAKQVEAAHSAALLVAAPELGALVVSGNDRLTWLNGLVTVDLAKCVPGDAVYGLAVAKSGKILADIVVVVDDARVLVVVPASEASALRMSLDHYLIMEDAEIVLSDAFTAFFAHGPRAGEVLAAARAAGAVGGVLDRTGLGGAIILAESEVEPPVRAAMSAVLAACGGVEGDGRGWDTLRIERAVPAFGAEFDGATYPQEAGLEKTAVSFNKGCYLGQEVVCMLEMRGKVKKRIVPLVLDGDAPVRGAAVTDAGGVSVGEVTSAVWSPTLGRAIALAMVKRQLTEPGSELRVGGAVAKVVERPA